MVFSKVGPNQSIEWGQIRVSKSYLDYGSVRAFVVPVLPRAESLAAIDAAMKRIAERIRKGLRGAQVTEVVIQPEKAVTKLLIRVGGVQTKIEVTPVLRGCVYEPKLLTVSRSVEETFGFAEVRVVSSADLYGGKIVAALDRQHPRDLNSPQLSVRPSD
jgi:hypothetical protein